MSESPAVGSPVPTDTNSEAFDINCVSVADSPETGSSFLTVDTDAAKTLSFN